MRTCFPIVHLPLIHHDILIPPLPRHLGREPGPPQPQPPPQSSLRSRLLLGSVLPQTVIVMMLPPLIQSPHFPKSRLHVRFVSSHTSRVLSYHSHGKLR